jgi:hypothetical protein
VGEETAYRSEKKSKKDKKAKKEKKMKREKAGVTTLDFAAHAGENILHVASHAGFQVGDTISIDEGGSFPEVNTITAFGPFILQLPLMHGHPPGTKIRAVPQVSSNDNIYMHAGSPHVGEMRQESIQDDSIYKMYADVYYSGQSDRPRLPLPAFPTGRSAAEKKSQSSPQGPSLSNEPRVVDTIVYNPVREGSGAQSPITTSHIMPEAMMRTASFGRETISTIVHEPVPENRSLAVLRSGQMPVGAQHLLPVSTGSISAVVRQSPTQYSLPVRPSAHLATSGAMMPLSQMSSKEERYLVGEVVHEPVVPQRFGEVNPQVASSMQFSSGSYTASYDSGYSQPAKQILL